MFAARHDVAIQLDGHPARIVAEFLQQFGDRQNFRQLTWFGIHGDGHNWPGPEAFARRGKWSASDLTGSEASYEYSTAGEKIDNSSRCGPAPALVKSTWRNVAGSRLGKSPQSFYPYEV